jgi:hypothetical protein
MDMSEENAYEDPLVAATESSIEKNKAVLATNKELS